MKTRLVSNVLATVLFAGCAVSKTAKDKAFSHAVRAVQGDDFVGGADAAYEYIQSADQDDPRYDRGLLLLARSLDGLEITWAAGMLYRNIAQARRNMELVPDAVAGIARVVATGLYDEDSMITSFVAAEDFSGLPEDIQAFVDFHKGLDMARSFSDYWADDHFQVIPDHSPWAAEAAYVKVVRFVADGDYARAIEILKELREAPNVHGRLLQDVERSLARLAFEEGRYEDALEYFLALKEMAPDDPEILLEMAWTYYYLGDSRKALGLLIALDAPVHRAYIAPERYLLEALALRRVCQFGPARQAVVRLERKYGATLQALHGGVLPRDIPQLRDAARLRGRTRINTLFMRQLEREKARLSELSDDLDPALNAFLYDIYLRGLAEVARRERELIGEDLTELTEELLAAREGVRLIVHELGVALLRGRRRPAGVKEQPPVEVPITGELVFYPFVGEYWTDELDDLIVIAEDRCID